MRVRAIAFAVIAVLARAAAAQDIPTSALKTDVDGFFDREVASHFLQIPETGPLPDRVHGALTTGEFSWGTFVRALAAYADTRGTRMVGGRDVIPLIGRVGVIESVNGSKAFAQLYAALALRHFGADLSKNALWQSLSADDRVKWKALLDPTRFYNPKTRQVIDLPENYLGVASRVATLSFQMGVITDRAFVDALLDRAAEPFTRPARPEAGQGNTAALYADDAGTAGRYDRYSNEYARYVYEAAETVGRKDLLAALSRSIRAQSKLWWDLVSPDGYGYNWGRSLGVVSYLDTLEIAAFLALHPELRPAPLADLAGEYRLAWIWLRDNYDPNRHILQVFAPGRGNYAYITKEREWQQNVGFFGKALMAHDTLMRVLAAEKIASIPAKPRLPAVARFEFFRHGDRPAGVWLVRQGQLRFALPITTGTKPGVADYLPAPHGLPGFTAPVEQTVPAGASYFELADGRVLAATDGADEIYPSPDGRWLKATWRRFARVGGKTGELVDPGFSVSITWTIDGTSLTRTEVLSASKDVSIKKVAFLLSKTSEGTLEATTSGPLAFQSSVRAVGDEPLGRGPRVPIPTHVSYESSALQLRAGESTQWVMRLTAK